MESASKRVGLEAFPLARGPVVVAGLRTVRPLSMRASGTLAMRETLGAREPLAADAVQFFRSIDQTLQVPWMGKRSPGVT